MTVLKIGCAALGPDLRRQLRGFDYAEVDLSGPLWPKLKMLEAVRARAPEAFEFGVRLPRDLAAVAEEDARPVISKARELGGVLRASWLIVSDGARVRPTERTRERLEQAFAGLRGERWAVGWQPHGLWEPQRARDFAAQCGVDLVVDPLDPKSIVEPGHCYFRVSSLSLRGGLRSGQLERMAERLAQTELAYLVLPRQTKGASEAARVLRRQVGLAADELSGELDDDDAMALAEFDEEEAS